MFFDLQIPTARSMVHKNNLVRRIHGRNRKDGEKKQCTGQTLRSSRLAAL